MKNLEFRKYFPETCHLKPETCLNPIFLHQTEVCLNCFCNAVQDDDNWSEATQDNAIANWAESTEDS